MCDQTFSRVKDAHFPPANALAKKKWLLPERSTAGSPEGLAEK